LSKTRCDEGGEMPWSSRTCRKKLELVLRSAAGPWLRSLLRTEVQVDW